MNDPKNCALSHHLDRLDASVTHAERRGYSAGFAAGWDKATEAMAVTALRCLDDRCRFPRDVEFARVDDDGTMVAMLYGGYEVTIRKLEGRYGSRPRRSGWPSNCGGWHHEEETRTS